MKSTVILMFLVCGAFARTASAQYWTPGITCQGAVGGSSSVYRYEGGVGNASSTTTLYVNCPMIYGNQNSLQNVSTYSAYKVYATIGAAGASESLWCVAASFTHSASGWWGTTKYLCSTNGGCASGVAGANVTNYMTLNLPGTLGTWGQVECAIPPDEGYARITGWVTVP
jgi:hypothetical protein